MGYDVSTGTTIELLRAYDDYPDGKLELAEFSKLASDLNRAAGPVSASVRSAFDRFDKNRSGFLDYRELRNALKHMRYDISTATTIELLRAYDDHPDGKLDVYEFGKLVRDLDRNKPRGHKVVGGGGGGRRPAPFDGGGTIPGSGPGGRGRTPPSGGGRPSASVRAAFEFFDKNRSGFLDYRELRNALTYMGYDCSTGERSSSCARTTTTRTASSNSPSSPSW